MTTTPINRMNLRTCMKQLHDLQQLQNRSFIEGVRMNALTDRLAELVAKRGDKQRAEWAATEQANKGV